MNDTMRTLIVILGTMVLTCSVIAHDHGHSVASTLEFHANKGQWPGHVLFSARTGAGAVFVERSAFTYVVQRGGPSHASAPGAVIEPFRAHAYKVHFEGGNARTAVGIGERPHYVNYFLGSDPANWAGHVQVFEGAELNGVYPGIDLHIGASGGFKYEWSVAPGADPSRISMRFEGTDDVTVKNGLLYVGTSAGDVVEQRPVAWSVAPDGQRIPVRCEYALNNGALRYDLPEGYDATLPLVIDPLVVFSSYSGSTGDNFGFTATYDAGGHLYGGGMVRSTGYPVTLGVQQSVYGGGENDFAISKFSPNGDQLVWSTYIGGTGNEVPHSMVVNSADELYILGTSNSTDFPTTTGCWDASFNGGGTPPFAVTSYGFTYATGCDVVVVHLSADAASLVGSTWVGGSGNDGLNQETPTNRNYGDPFRGEIVLDADERPLAVTSTSSTGLFTTPGAVQATFGGVMDAYVFRMDPQLSTMLWATYFGGPGVDSGFGVQVSGTGDVYITGGTTSTTLPAAGSPAFASFNGGAADGYIARFSPDGSTLLGRTYLGTAGFDQSYFVQLDTNNDVYVVGQTTGSYPISPGKYNNANATQFLHKFSSDLGASLWSTRIGGSGDENISPSAFLVSNCGQIYFSGWAGTTNGFGTGALSSTTIGLPTTSDAFQSTTNGSDFYLMLLEADAVALGYATFFGGSSSEHVDGGTSRFDKNGIVYQAVCAGCQNLGYPTTPGAWSQTNNSTNCNLGVFKIDFEQNVQVNIEASIESAIFCLDEPVLLNAVGTADEWSWDLGDGTTVGNETNVAHIYAEPGTYTITLVGTALGLCVAQDTAQVEVQVVAPAELSPRFDAVPSGSCDAFIVELFNSSSGSTTYLWSFGDGSGSTQTNPVHTYAGPGDYTITLGVIDPVCSDTAFLSVEVPVELPGLELDLPSPAVLCADGAVNLDAGAGYDSYLWSTSEQAVVITVDSPGDYWVEVTDGFCVGQDTITVLGSPSYPPFADVELCPGEREVLMVPFAASEVVWSNGTTGNSLVADAPGIYWYAAQDAFGCSYTDTVVITLAAVSDEEPFIPNVFTPNGDGKNERYLPVNIDDSSFSMDIYNRWGMKVYGSVNSSVGWNGKLDNSGEPVPDGTYFVVLTYSAYCDNKQPVTVTGHVTLLR